MSFDLETDRLLLRPVASHDAEALHALWTDTDVRRYLWDGEIIPFEQTAAVIAESVRLFATEGRGLWGAWTRGDQALCGFGGFWYFRVPPELELLYGLDRARWGHGYATEIARAVVEFGFTRLAMSEVRASTDAPNLVSVRVLERLGFTPERRATVNGLDTVFFRHSRPA